MEGWSHAWKVLGWWSGKMLASDRMVFPTSATSATQLYISPSSIVGPMASLPLLTARVRPPRSAARRCFAKAHARPLHSIGGYSIAVRKVPSSLQPIAACCGFFTWGITAVRSAPIRPGTRRPKSPVGFTDEAPHSYWQIVCNLTSGCRSSNSVSPARHTVGRSKSAGAAGCSDTTNPPRTKWWQRTSNPCSAKPVPNCVCKSSRTLSPGSPKRCSAERSGLGHLRWQSGGAGVYLASENVSQGVPRSDPAIMPAR